LGGNSKEELKIRSISAQSFFGKSSDFTSHWWSAPALV